VISGFSSGTWTGTSAEAAAVSALARLAGEPLLDLVSPDEQPPADAAITLHDERLLTDPGPVVVVAVALPVE
jgi:hypothetical protein